MTDRDETGSIADPRTLMLGCGWFPNQLGGLNRYFRDLFEHVPNAEAIVVGNSAAPPAKVTAVSGHERPLPTRLFAVWRASQQVASRVDVIDAHFALYALLTARVGRLSNAPMIVHFQGPWADENVAVGDRSRARHRARRLLERATYTRADAIVVLTSAFRQTLVENYRIQPWNVHVEPPGVDLMRFTPGDQDDARRKLEQLLPGVTVPAGAVVAVCVRRLVPRMGIRVLLDAWREVAPQLPDGSILLIAGEGELLAELRQHAAANNIAKGSVAFLGRIADDDLVTVYRAADVNVVPSLSHEGFGLVVIEAAACGTPSIVTNVGGLPEAIAGLDESLVVPADDPGAIAERLLTTLPARRATREFAERFTWAGVAARHQALAQTVVDTGRTKSRQRRRAVRPGRPIRVVYLDHVARLSGGEIAMLRLLPHLRSTDAHVILAEDGPLVGRLHRAGISTEVFQLDEAARGLRKSDVHRSGLDGSAISATVRYIVRLAHHLRRLAPDLVHTNSLKAGVYGSLASRLARIPVIWHVRDRIADDYLPPTAVALIRRMTRHLAAAVVANSHSTLATLAAPSNPVVLYSVLPEVVSQMPLRPPSSGGPLTFGTVGRLAPWKGQDLFLRAFARAFPAGDQRATVVGGALFGEDEFALSLPGLAQQLGIADRVDLRGHCDDVWDELAQMDVLVHTSRTPEPFGQVVLEGMAAGVPVIAAGAGGPAEMLRHDETGVLYEPSNEDELASAMRRLQDSTLRARLSGAARQELGPYAPEAVAQQLEALYTQVVARERHR